METADKLIEQAAHLMSRMGVKNLTMDELARQMGISKKTIYQFFRDKNEVVARAVSRHCDMERVEIERIHHEAVNAIDELYKLSQFMRSNVETLHPSVLHDLQKYHPDAWQVFVDYKEEVFKMSIIKSLQWGKNEGFFRVDIDEDILAVMRLKQVELAFDPLTYPRHQYNFTAVCEQLFYHFIHGILTEEGKKEYDRIFNN